MSFKTINPTHKKKITKEFFYSWEMILVYLLIAINVLLMIFVNDVYFTSGNIQTIIRCGMEISFMVLGMTFILILGEIDVSVASIMLLSATVMGLTYENMVPVTGEGMAATMAIILGILAGGCCGLLNGVLVAIVKMPSVITTIGTSFLFRGIVHIILGGSFKTDFPKFFEPLAWDDIGGVIPVSLIVFLIFAAVFCVILHRSKYGRQLYLVGNNRDTANYSGIRVAKTKIIAYVIMGMTTALSAMVFVGRLGGIDYTMATGYELKVIAVVVLGGVSTLGGKGKLYGPIIATFFMAFLLKSLDLFEVQQNVQKIAIGIILILAVLIPRINKNTILAIKLKFTRKAIRQIEGTDIPHNINEAKKKVLDEEKVMNTAEFYRFIDTLKLTTNPIDRNIYQEELAIAKKDYLAAKATLKGINKEDKKNYDKALATLKDKKDALEKTKDAYALNTDVRRQEIRTIYKLLKLNEGRVIDEINTNAKRFVREYRNKRLMYSDSELVKYLAKLEYTSWNIKDYQHLPNVGKALNEYLKNRNALRLARITKNKKSNIHTLVNARHTSLVNYLVVRSEHHIMLHYHNKKRHTEQLIRLLNKRQKEIKDEKK
ncbi:MAG: ABC transporter permease [Bacilli bacterium]|nr:ABC transporter permease [Bacilli bacterium]